MGDAYTFDPVVLGDRECDAWVHYYRREWVRPARLARARLRRVRMGPRRTVLGAWLVLRANQVWAPYPDNDPDAARELMRRFYALVVADQNLDLDPVEAAPGGALVARASGPPARFAGFERGSTGGRGGGPLRLRLGCLDDGSRGGPVARRGDGAVGHVGRGGCSPSDPTLVEERRDFIASYCAARGDRHGRRGGEPARVGIPTGSGGLNHGRGDAAPPDMHRDHAPGGVRSYQGDGRAVGGLPPRVRRRLGGVARRGGRHRAAASCT